MKLETFAEQLDDLDQRYQEWSAPIDQVRQEKWHQVVEDQDYTYSDYQTDIEQAEKQQRANEDLIQELDQFMDDLCTMYLAATPDECRTIRTLMSSKERMLDYLEKYTAQVTKRVKTSADREWFLKGLAAISIENCPKDFRDTLMVLADLYIQAEEVGLEPQAACQLVAKLSSREAPRGGSTPVSQIFADFDTYAVVEERRKKVAKQVKPASKNKKRSWWTVIFG